MSELSMAPCEQVVLDEVMRHAGSSVSVLRRGPLRPDPSGPAPVDDGL